VTAFDVGRLRAHYARDLCVCDHMRQQHYSAILGATAECGSHDCHCTAYAWSRQEGDISWF